MNKDGRADLVATTAAGAISVLLGASVPGQFEAGLSASVGHEPVAFALADLDGDGQLDLAAADRLGDSLSVRLGDGLGQFAGHGSFVVSSPIASALGDVNADGALDVVTIGNVNTIQVAFGDGQGGVGAVTVLYAPDAPRALELTDLNHDGVLDLVTRSGIAANLTVRLGLPQGAFGQPASYPAGGIHARRARAGDMNGDGHADLVVSLWSSASVAVLLGDGLGAFGAPTLAPAGLNPSGLDLGDIDGDGNLDVALACEGSDDVFVLRGDGAGGLAFAFALPVGSRPPEVVLGDFNSDGRLDCASVNRDSNDVSVAINAGPGALWSVSSYPIGGSASALTASDLDGDGLLDLAVASFVESRPAVVVLPGRAQGSFAAAARSRVGSLPVDVLAGDLNGDGRTDLVAASSALNRLDLLLNQSRTGPETYCTAGISTNGCSALLSSTGAPSASNAQPFVVQVSGMDAGRSTVMFIGANGSTGIPWSSTSSSSVCVRAPIQRAAFGNSGGTAGACDGAFAFDLNAYLVTNPVIGGTPVIAGASLNVQAWFRDGSAPRGSNLSNAMELLVGP